MTSHDRRFIDNVANRFLLVTNGALQEISEPEAFYQTAAEITGDLEGRFERMSAATSDTDPRGSSAHASGGVGDEAAEEEMLERIVELEGLLAADRARKPKFQKLKHQAAWVEELAALNARLGGEA